ncbi:hypothetical protein [Mycobacteroides salmoniphilum]|uniref:hypothetical protein n=1 Tax=Mycobacteroides salmoniphilum TaxID=404941 RepID=UPI001F30C9B4|nr:hypothetical protein [Mycobacteroides salmoniphilum]
MNDANRPTRGSTPAITENEIASGIRASATTRPARTSVRIRGHDRSAAHTEVLVSPASEAPGICPEVTFSPFTLQHNNTHLDG